MNDISWYCFKRILPKVDYELVPDNNNDRLAFYKEGDPILVLQKSHRYPPLYVESILRRVQLNEDKFSSLLQQCTAAPTF